MQEDHHFCRWHLPEGFSAEAALAAAFPNASRAQAAHQLDTCSPKELREVFATIFGSVTTSNNTSWIRQKLKGALGLGGKKQRTTSHAGGRKRSAGPFENGRGKQARAASPDSPPAGSHWAGFGPASGGRSPRLGRSPSSDWDCFSMKEWDDGEEAGDSSAAAAGAATLLAAAAEVESREAAAAAAAGTSAGCASHSHSPAGRALEDSPGDSATGSSLRPPPADASQQVQAFLQGFLQAAQATGASAPTPPAVAAAGVPAAATGAAGQAAGQAPGAALPFLTPQQLSSVGQQAAVFRLLAALAAAPNGHPM